MINIEELMGENKNVSVVEFAWKENKKNEIIKNKTKEIEKEYFERYPNAKITETKIGDVIIGTRMSTIDYIEYDKEEEVPVLDENGNPITDPETGEIKTELKPVLPGECYKEDEEGNKVLKDECKDKPLRPTLDYFIEKKIKEWLQDPENLKVDMNEFVNFIKPYMFKLVNVEFDEAMNVVTKAYPEHEQLTWDQQEREARAYKANPQTAKTPLISKIAKTRGIDLATLANKIIEKADNYKTIVGAAIGYRQDAHSLIESIKTYDNYKEIISELEAKKDIFYKIVKGE